MKPYYYVYRVGHNAPKIKHQSLESAHAEANRLSAQHPGDTFEILQALAIVQTKVPSTFWMDGVEPPKAKETPYDRFYSSLF